MTNKKKDEGELGSGDDIRVQYFFLIFFVYGGFLLYNGNFSAMLVMFPFAIINFYVARIFQHKRNWNPSNAFGEQKEDELNFWLFIFLGMIFFAMLFLIPILIGLLFFGRNF
tara:strand:+ start:251 stop:586 length:336 start_codon:yes stop_codon:yes gene_type:complete